MTTIKKRLLLWDWTNTRDCPQSINLINFTGPISSVSNWNTWTPAELPHGTPFQPTIRTTAQLEGQDWGNILKYTAANKDSMIHFLNEPERVGTTAKEAAKLWKEKIVPLRKVRGVKVVGPACASDGPGEKWIGEFLSLVGKEEGPDFLGVHYYGTSGEEAIKFLKRIHKKFPRMKVVVSEIGCTSRDYRDVLEFTVELCNWMDEQEWILEYGFFGCMRNVADDFVSPAAQLMKPDGTLTDLMGKYMNEQPMVV